jgi:translocation and assembly module TamA
VIYLQKFKYKNQLYIILYLLLSPIFGHADEYDNLTDDVSDYIYVKVKVNGVNKVLKKYITLLADFDEYNYKINVEPEKIQSAHNDVVENIASYMISQGYYKSKITNSLTNNFNSWLAVYNITAGPRIIIDNLRINVQGPGRELLVVRNFLDKIPIKSGDGFVHSVYEETKKSLIKLLKLNSYLDAKYSEHEIAVNINNNTADIDLVLNTGPRYYFGHISIEENQIDPELINRFILLKEGEFYSSSKIIEQQNALGDSDYYSEVHINPRRDLAIDNKIPIEITTQLRKPSKYSLGLGYSTDAGVNGSIAWSKRRLNYQGHRLYVGAAVSKLGGTVGMRYRIPFRNPRYDEYVITTNYINTNTDTSESQIAQFGVARSLMRSEWREILALDLRRERFIVGKQDDISNLVLPSASWSWVVPRGQLYISKGHMLSITTRASSKALFSDASFAQSDINTKWIFPVSSRGRFLTRARLGLSSVDDVLDLPASFRYFTGGDQSVRGYAFASLGPKNSDGEVIGGKHLLVGSIEYDYRLKGDWSIAAFYDIGNAFSDVNALNAARGAGLGIRWKTIVGQIRIDIASALSEPDNPKRIHLSIGPDF